MIVCHTHQFIFVRLPKTASTSLSIALSGLCGPDDVITPLVERDEAIRVGLGFPGAQNYLQPWYRYSPRELAGALVRRRRPEYKHPRANEVRRFVGSRVWAKYFKFCIERNPFDRAISSYHYAMRKGALDDINTFICSLHDRSLSNWHRYSVGNRIVIDHVGRYEDLSHEVTTLASRLRLASIVLPAVVAKGLHRLDRRHYSQVLNLAARRRIEAACAREIEVFGYQWTDEPTSGESGA